MSGGRLGVATGSSTLDGGMPPGDWVVLQRHAGDAYVLPHLIDHAAHMRSLVEAGCDRVLAISSVGGLRPELGPGTFVCPGDFIALDAAPTVFDDERAHGVPGFDEDWRQRVLATWRDAGGVPLRESGVYWQARGPRLETPAEIRLIAAHADVVGMTVASECIVARELGLAYAAICVVDNLANGVRGEGLTMPDLEAGREANRTTLASALGAVLPLLA